MSAVATLALLLTLQRGPCCLCECKLADQSRCAQRCVAEKTQSNRGAKKCVKTCAQSDSKRSESAQNDSAGRREFELATAIAKLDADQVVREVTERVPGFDVEGEHLTISEKAMRRILLLLQEADEWRREKR